MLNGLSVDVEEWFQVGAFERVDRQGRLGRAGSAASSTIPARCSTCSPRAGSRRPSSRWAGSRQRHPALIRRIVDAGHEVASHGWDHQRVFTMDAAQFRADLARARAALEDASGQRITGYRAPSFSIDQRTPWAHAGAGRGGISLFVQRRADRGTTIMAGADAPRHAYRPVAGSTLIELPVTPRRVSPGGRWRPAAGSFGCCPAAMTDFAVRQVNARCTAGDVLFPPVGGRSRPAAGRRGAAANRGCGITAGWARWRASCADLIARHDWGRVDAVVARRSVAAV